MPKGSLLMLFVIALAWIPVSAVFGQYQRDSTTVWAPITDTFERSVIKGDSTLNTLQKSTDSLQRDYQRNLAQMDGIQDSLAANSIVQTSTKKIDSLQRRFYQRSDSLQSIYKHKVAKLDAAKSSLQHKADSLTTLKLPAHKLLNQIDSVNRARQEVMGEFDAKLKSIKNQTTSQLNKLDLPTDLKEKINAATKNIEGVNFASDINIPSWEMPKDINLLGDLQGVGKQFPSGLQGNKLPGADIPVTGDVESLTNINGKVPDVANVGGQVNNYASDAKQIANENLDEAKRFPKTVEEKAAERSGIQAVDQKSKALDEYKSMTTKAQDPNTLKKEAAAKAKQVAVDHFAGKEEQLKAAMEKMSKYKQKYSSMQGVKELSKKHVNPLHEKPLRERIIPGIAIQLQSRGEHVLVDFNPYATYLFTPRLRGGLGWNQRVGYNTDQRSFNPAARIYGPRIFGEFKLGKGFYPRAEFEMMNTRVPPASQSNIDPLQREWVSGVFVGMKKQYKLIRNINGAAMAMARLYNPGNKSPYADILNVRFGFEIPMKKKVKPK